MTSMKISMLLLLVVVFASIDHIQAQTEFTRRNHFSLGDNVTVAKFSSDYTLLAVLRQGQNKLFSYNPNTFQLIGEQVFEGGIIPVSLQIFGTDIIIAAQPNILAVYQRKVNSSQLTLKQMVKLKSFGGINGMRLEKLTEDFNDKGQANSTRHLVVWSVFSQSSFEVYKYVAAQDTNKITFLFDKVYQPPAPNFSDFEFFDEKFLVFGIKSSNTVGETYLIELSNTSKITKFDSKVSQGMKSFNIKPKGSLSSSNFLAIGQSSSVGQFKSKGKSIEQGSKPISPIALGRGFSDNNKMIGFYNQKSIHVYKMSELFYQNYPTYTARLQEDSKQGQRPITIVSMPQSNTGQLIVNHCYENNQVCFYYYSLCGPNTYYTTNTVGTEVCKKCTADANCEKCLNDACVKCNSGFYFNSTKKCQQCTQAINGCTSCSQNGKTCYSCDSKQYEKDPVDNVCQCFKGTVWDATTKACVQCQTKITFCAACNSIQNTTYECTSCANGLNRVPSDDKKSCICDQFYFQSVSKICQLCDPYKKCKKCSASNQCQQCDITKQWTLNTQGKCECLPSYVEVNNECLLCSILGCKTCQTDTTCKTCKQGFRLQQNQQCVCNGDRFLNQNTKECELCSSYIDGCSECSNNKACSVCDAKKNREVKPTTEGKCLCKSQYTENSKKQCALCTTPGCLNCETNNQCTSCDENSGFNTTVTDGKCQCIVTKFLDKDSNKCKNCSASMLGCYSCSNASKCEVCDWKADFILEPVDGACKCISNFFVSQGQCLKCQVICEHCNKCVQIVTSDMFTTSVGCAQCDDGFEVEDSKCVQKSGNLLLYILIPSGILLLVVIAAVCYCKKKSQRRQIQDQRKSRQNNASLVTMLLKNSVNEVITTDRTEIGTNKNYQPLFSGNINYSLASNEKDADRKSFNETLKQMQRERKAEMDKKNKPNNNNYSELSKNMSGGKKSLTEQEQADKKKNNLFSHRGKG